MLPDARSARSPMLSVVPVIFSPMNASTSVLFRCRSSQSGHDTSVVPGGAAIGAGDREQPLLIDDQRIGTQQDAFDPAEDRGVGADAEREAQDRQEGKAGTAPQHPEPVPKVMNHGSNTLPKPRSKRLRIATVEDRQPRESRPASVSLPSGVFYRRSAARTAADEPACSIVARAEGLLQRNPRENFHAATWVRPARRGHNLGNCRSRGGGQGFARHRHRPRTGVGSHQHPVQGHEDRTGRREGVQIPGNGNLQSPSNKKLTGKTPKFACKTDSDDELKVKYRRQQRRSVCRSGGHAAALGAGLRRRWAVLRQGRVSRLSHGSRRHHPQPT